MRGLQLSGHAWRPCLSSAAVSLRTFSSCTTSTSGAAVVVTASRRNGAVLSAVYITQRLYRTTQQKKGTSDAANSDSGTTVGTSVGADATSDDAMDLIWSDMPDVHEPNHEATLTSGPHEHRAAAATRAPKSSPHEESRASDASDTAASLPEPPVSHVWVSMHNMPRNWLHEDIVEMIHQVAEHAGIAASEAPLLSESAAGREGDVAGEGGEEGHTGEGTSSALNHVSSPFVRRLHIPFGRRTGLVYGSPKLLLTSRQLADYLLHRLSFDPDDFRSRVYFTRTKPEELPSGFQQQQQPREGGGAEGDAANGDGVAQVTYTPIEETVEREQDEALRTLVLDRYLFAPDLLLDIAKSHQRRLVTKNEKVLLDAFVDGEEDSDADEEDEDGGDVEDDDAVGGGSGADGDAESAAATLTRRHRRRQRHRATSTGGPGKRKSPLTRRVRAGTQKHLGRGSMHNMPIPKPYVVGRNL
ncbi:conserved hypothetical protein [Leishmania major strain Friedlin]|uniref:Uncharacterized protein n=1 Tax=Leishmania major TaxID=5664 RepID=Q4QFS4_LEIMA|nr:conserved hypothetical protein [Leishmania major strain Friedlin]CAG9571246.1 hypothetical_protein_-_conserved [Leishmania major strain Friedlin]CAJ02937.1 conserved hypothetical protein [Leishmania major strain Friedlin]|eukprot:XP_001687660.1 conserved hypothetical protein [Leishmania major strain Friedlin]